MFRQVLTEIHRNLSGMGDMSRVILRQKFVNTQFVCSRDEFLNLLDGNYARFLFLRNVPDRILSQAFGYGLAF